MRFRIHTARRSFGYPPCGRQNDVTGTIFAPVTSSHSMSGDVMTSPDCVCAGSEDALSLYRSLDCVAAQVIETIARAVIPS